MRTEERIQGLLKAPRLAWNILVGGRYDFVYDRMEVHVRRMSVRKRLNLVRAGGNLLYRKRSAWSMPLHMQFELTNYCNLRCPVCATGSRALTRRPQAMDPALFAHVMDEVGPYLLTASLWGWGESLLHPQLDRILRAARKHDVTTLLSTNGQNLNDERVLRAIIDAPPTCLIVAIDGLSDETNVKYRVGARLAPALEGVRRLAELKRERGSRWPVLHMRYIVMRHNQHELPEVEAYAREHCFEFLSTRALSIIDTASPDAVAAPFVPDEPGWRAYAYEGDRRLRRPGFVCQEPFWFPTLLADGTLVSCEQDFNAQAPMGVVSVDNSFTGVWYSELAAQRRQAIRDNPDSFSFCRNCPYDGREQSDCSIESRVLRPDAVCFHGSADVAS